MVRIAPDDADGGESGQDETTTRVERGAREAADAEPEPADSEDEDRAESEPRDRRETQEAVDPRIGGEPDTDITTTETERGAREAREQQRDSTPTAAAEGLARGREQVGERREEQRRAALRSGEPDSASPLLTAREDEVRVRYEGDEMRVGLDNDARERIARQQFDIDRDPQRVFSGTERVPVGFSEEDLEFEAQDDGVAIQISDAAAEERLRNRLAGRYEDVDPEDVEIEETDEGELRASVDVQQQGRPTNAAPQTREQEVLDTLSFGLTRRVRAAEDPVQVNPPDAPDVDVQTNTDALFAQAQGREAGPVVDVDVEGLDMDGEGGAITGAAAAGVAAPEPVSTGAGLAILGAAAAGGLIASSVELNLPDEQQQGELEVGSGTVESELEPNQEVGRTEIEVPEEETVVQPEELGVPQEAAEQGEIEVTGGELTDDGEIIIPAGTTQVASETRYEDEEEKEEEEEAEEDEEAEEEEEVVVSVPEEFIPKEEVVIGGEAADEAAEEEVEEVEEAEEEDIEDVEQVEVIQGQDTAFPEDTQTTGEFDEQPGVEQVTQPAESDLADAVLGGVGAGTAAGATGVELVGVGALEEESAAAAETAAPQTAELTAPLAGTLEAVQVAQLEVQAQQPALESVSVGVQATPAQLQAQPQAEVVETVTTQALGQGFAQATAQAEATTQDIPFPDLDADDGDDIFGLGGAQGEILTDFIDPLSGGVLETESEVGGDDVVLPGF